LECPAKVHHFLWRLGHHSLPTRMNIERKRVDLDTRCPMRNMIVRCWQTSWEPQEEGVMSTTVSFFSVMKLKFNRPVGERNHFRRLLLTGFWQGTLPVPVAMWNLHTIQPRYFAPTCSEVVNLTGLLKTKD
jgi:hypothetical protein